MLQEEAVQDARNATRSSLRNCGRQRAAGMLDAVKDYAKPGKDAVVFAEVRREFPVQSLQLHETEVLLVEFLADLQRAIVEYQATSGRRFELAEVPDEAGVV